MGPHPKALAVGLHRIGMDVAVDVDPAGAGRSSLPWLVTAAAAVVAAHVVMAAVTEEPALGLPNPLEALLDGLYALILLSPYLIIALATIPAAAITLGLLPVGTRWWPIRVVSVSMVGYVVALGVLLAIDRLLFRHGPGTFGQLLTLHGVVVPILLGLLLAHRPIPSHYRLTPRQLRWPR